ncbi:MAG: response regulator [Candidatus Shapirobacteria bacterium]
MYKKILIIEDDLFSASIYKEHLDKNGFISQVASDGRIALDMVDTFRPSLIILDLILPKIDGFTLLHFFKEIPVIVISNLEHEKVEGVKFFISKSKLDYSKLINQINNILFHR